MHDIDNVYVLVNGNYLNDGSRIGMLYAPPATNQADAWVNAWSWSVTQNDANALRGFVEWRRSMRATGWITQKVLVAGYDAPAKYVPPARTRAQIISAIVDGLEPALNAAANVEFTDAEFLNGFVFVDDVRLQRFWRKFQEANNG